MIVVDNGSRADEHHVLLDVVAEVCGDGFLHLEADEQSVNGRGVLPEVTVLSLTKNVGYARGNNAGLILAYDDPEVTDVMVLNNDILFTSDIIPKLLEARKPLKDCAIISPLLYRRDCRGFDINCARRNVTVGQLIRHNFLHFWWRLRGTEEMRVNAGRYMLNQYKPEQYPELMPIELPSGSCMLIDKELFKRIDSFDPHTFLYFEENILYCKLKERGLQNYLYTPARCIHLGAATTSTRTPGKFLVRTGLDSERYYVKRYSKAPMTQQCIYRLSAHCYWLSVCVVKFFKRS